MNPPLTLKLRAALELRDKQGILLRLPPPPSPASRENTLDFASNDYLCLSRLPELRHLFLERIQAAENILGSGGSRILVNPVEHTALEARLAIFFNAPVAMVAGSGYDANVAFFRHIPQPGDIILHDEYVHASIYDGMRTSRAQLIPFAHNTFSEFQRALKKIVVENPDVMQGTTSVFLVVETVYSMDGSIAPLRLMVDALEEELPGGNGHLVVDEAHATGVYGPEGRGIVAMHGLESKCLARLHTFGKAMCTSGAVLLTTPLVRDYLINHGRALFFTTAPNHATIISIDCVLDILQNGTGARLATHLLEVCTYLTQLLRLKLVDVPRSILALAPDLYRPISMDVGTLPVTTLPPVIVALLTPRAWELSAYLSKRGIIACAVVFPVVPRDKPRVRITVHADKTKKDVEMLVDAVLDWAKEVQVRGGASRVDKIQASEFERAKM